jgi:hypothetical protein
MCACHGARATFLWISEEVRSLAAAAPQLGHSLAPGLTLQALQDGANFAKLRLSQLH